MARVLLVDDEEALRLMMGRQLRRAGHEMTLAEDGLAALELLEKEAFDVVVSDVKMPRLDGMGLLARAAEMVPDTEFIILTGHGSLENAVEAFKTGQVFDYLLKPLEDIRELDAVVERAVERRHLRHENGRLVRELEARVEELEAAKLLLAHQAERDGLTGLYNHRTIHQRLDALLRAEPDAPLAVMLVDMDGFKRINDAHGHPTGDQVLRYLAQTLRDVSGEETALGRCGGDEFMALFPGATSAQAGEAAERIREYLGGHPFPAPDGVRIPLQVCFGVADVAGVGTSAHSLVAAADSALYEAKNAGGDRIILHLTPDTPEGAATATKYDVLDGLVTAIDRKDLYTRRHSEDVTRLALTLVEALGSSGETHNAVRVAGLLHDIGKIGVPDAILRKPGRLTPEEYVVMQGHVTLSALIIHGLPRLADILDAVAHHHERWDGKGYPKGLAGAEIPLLGRVLAIADAYSAMTLDRPYRARLSQEQALEEILRGAGIQFDPDLASLFVESMRSDAIRERQAA